MIPIIHNVYEAIFKLQVEHVRLSRRVQIHKLVVRWTSAFSEFTTELTKPNLLVGRSVVFDTVEAGLIRLKRHLSYPVLHHTSAEVDGYLIGGSILIFYPNLLVERLFILTHCEGYARNWTYINGFLISVMADNIVLAN